MRKLVLDAEGNAQETTIALRTRSDEEIDNRQMWRLSKFEWAQLADLNRFRDAKKLGEACPIYNCHGLTFGSRRTSVFSSPLFILKEDGFRQIAERDTQIGDIAVYFDSNGLESHTGIVVGHSELIVPGSISGVGKVPLIWSKWAKGPEYVHSVGYCPYDSTNVRYYRLSWRGETDGEA